MTRGNLVIGSNHICI